MRWLITGKDGQLAKSLANFFDTKNEDYILLSKEELDVTDETQVKIVLQKYTPEVVINAAAWSDVDRAEFEYPRAYAVNALGPRFLAETTSHMGCKLVQISTDYVFSGDLEKPWKINSMTEPVNKYGISKLEGENFVKFFNPNHSYVIRTAWLYSKWKKNFVKSIAKLALETENKIQVVNDQIGQPTSASELSCYIYDVVSKKLPCGIYHGTNAGQASRYELAVKIFELVGCDSSRVNPVKTRSLKTIARRPKYSVLEHPDLSQFGIYEMSHWRTALSRDIDAIVENF